MAVAVCVIVVMFSDFSTYETFATAAANPGKQYHVIGVLEGNKQVQYDPKVDPNHCTFFVKDKAGNTKRVVFNGAKPTDIEKSEQIVMKGMISGDEFRCTQIQMKCPSKYKKDQVAVGNAT